MTVTAPYLDSVETFGPSFASPSEVTAPFLDTLFGFAPSVVGVDPAPVALYVAGVEVDASFGRGFQVQLDDPGSFSFTVQRDDFAGIDFDDPVRFDIAGVPAFHGLVEQIDHVALSAGEEADQVVTVAGRGLLALLERALVYPSRGIEALPIEEVRSFSWPSTDYVDSTWPLGKRVNRQRSYASWIAPMPWVWPDTLGWWIGPNLPSVTALAAPLGTWLARKTFTLAEETDLRIFGAGDNELVMYVDGAEMSEGTDFKVGRYVEVTLSAGTHVIACRVSNFQGISALNPTGLLVAAYSIGAAGLLDELIFRTDTTWRVLPYPATTPGFTHGQVLRLLIEEAGLDASISLDFTDQLDSGGNPWSEYREITVQVGRTLLDVVREMIDSYIDVEMANYTLRAWNRGGRGSVRPTTLQQTSDPATSDFLSLRHTGKRTRANTTLLRYAGGHREVIDSASETAYGTVGLFLNMGAVAGAPEADEIARVVMESRSEPAYATTAQLAPHDAAATPFDGYRVGDIIECPNESDVDEAMRVRDAAMSEDDDSEITWVVGLRDLAIETEERHDAWLRRMADGAAFGGSRVSSPAGAPQPSSASISALTVAEFSFDNSALVASLSPRRPAEVSGNLVEVYAEVTTAGSTSTTVRVLLNGSSIATLTIPAGETDAEEPLVILPIRANVDKLQCEIVSAGSGAEGLDVQVRGI